MSMSCSSHGPLVTGHVRFQLYHLQVCGAMMVFMKLPPPVQLPLGGTPAQRLDLAFRKVLTVSKEELLEAEAKLKHPSEKRRTKKKR